MNYSKELIKYKLEFLKEKGDTNLKKYNNIDIEEALNELFKLLSENNNLNNKHVIEDINVFVARIIFSFFFESTHMSDDYHITKILKGLLITEAMGLETAIKYFFAEFKNKNKLSDPNFIRNSLFEDEHLVPKLNQEIHRHLITFQDIDWLNIDLDKIYKSFYEFNKNYDNFSFKLMDFKEVSYIINALFLNDFNNEFETCLYNPIYLTKLRKKISSIKIFDPNCNTGAYLAVAYEKLSELELKIIIRLKEMGKKPTAEMVKSSQLYGLEDTIIGCLLSKLSLSLIDFKMQFKRKAYRKTKKFNFSFNSSYIFKENGLTVNWEDYCASDSSGIYVISNLYENEEYSQSNWDFQKDWLLKTAEYLNGNGAKAGLLCKDTISLDQTTSLVWKKVFDNNLHIRFLFSVFEKNNGLNNAVIIGLSSMSNNRNIYTIKDGLVKYKEVTVISPSINNNPFTAYNDISLLPKNYPKCKKGIEPESGSFLTLTQREKNELLKREPKAAEWVKRLVGTNEFIETLEAWCLWYPDIPYKDLNSLKRIRSLIYNVKIQKQKGTTNFKKMVNVFSLSNELTNKKGYSLIIPERSLKTRNYYPIGLYETNNLVSKTFIIDNANLYIFGILSSSMFNEWIELTDNTLSDYYHFSIEEHYNAFPWPSVNKAQVALIELIAEELLMVRESFPHINIKNLYGISTMPIEVLEIHLKLDKAVEDIFNPLGFNLSLDKKQYLAYSYNDLISKGKNEKI